MNVRDDSRDRVAMLVGVVAMLAGVRCEPAGQPELEAVHAQRIVANQAAAAIPALKAGLRRLRWKERGLRVTTPNPEGPKLRRI